MLKRALIGLTYIALAVTCACSKAETPVRISHPSVIMDGATTPPIVVDQFGYRPDGRKIAFAREAVEGFDKGAHPPIARTYVLTRVSDGTSVEQFTDVSASRVDPHSGDRVAELDFSNVTAPGTYIIQSEDGSIVSDRFEISEDVYAPVLKAAFRTFYYQRSGISKQPPFVPAEHTDTASHRGPEQDIAARLYSAKGNASTARDLSGGWYDAGDLNKYTNWTADYVLNLLAAYEANPDVWHDDFGIPESGNGVPDILDETRWGLDWLLRMQQEDGGVLSILASQAASPASRARDPSFYGPASTSASLSAAAAYAYGAEIALREGDKEYGRRLRDAALKAWKWAEANPDTTFYNNDPRDNSVGIGAGQQEVDKRTRRIKRLTAAARLFELTGDDTYQQVVRDLVDTSPLMSENYLSPYYLPLLDALLAYSQNPSAHPALANRISDRFYAARPTSAFVKAGAYQSTIAAHHWGSNSVKANRGVSILLPDQNDAGALALASTYLHYLHGLNPMGLVYLTEMEPYGAERSVHHLYHAAWKDRSLPPGFVTGGPNPTYTWDACCPSGCGSGNTCGAAPPSPPAGQPALKSYLDFDDGWPLGSWQINENSNGYQVAYLRLLAQFTAPPRKDAN